MLGLLEQKPIRRTLFVILFCVLFSASLFEILGEFLAGESLGEMSDDVIQFALTGVLLLILLSEYLDERNAYQDLSGKFDNMRGRLKQLDAGSEQIAGEYRKLVQKQFDEWQLTDSEQDVARELLRGLSFKEIAAIRSTKEKTVRQQASAVYGKAGVASRNELAAWFFEDLLNPE